VINWFHELLSQLTYAVSLGNPGGLATLFLLGVLSDIGVPFFFLLETFLFFASYYVGPLSSHVLLIVIMLLVGRECGAAVLYWLSFTLGNPLISWIGKRFPRVPQDLERFRTRLSKRTVVAVTVVRLTPGLLQVPSLAAGVMRLPYWRFVAGVAISSVIYDIAFITFGFLARIGLQNLAQQMRIYFAIGLVAVIVAVIVWFTVRRGFRR
jgi:membrane protein DedA with SNARE-associated domain